jgi:hypothetical protein
MPRTQNYGQAPDFARIDMTQMKRPEDGPDAFQAAWNAHDMQAFGTLFHGDGTFVNGFGHYVRGVKEIIDLHSHPRDDLS